jgi:3-deoxy-manno-octulosonate cytidylyltransferase (CMP-KDO synthetase)
MRPRVLGVVPARMGSTRLPGKPLLMIEGMPIVQWVHDAAVRSGVFARVVVATDDSRIMRCVAGFDGECLLTDSAIRSGSARVAATAIALGQDYDIVANIQGDQPFVKASDFRTLVRAFERRPVPDMTTLAAPLDAARARDPHTVKVVTDVFGRALYFSRSQIPFSTTSGPPRTYLQHVGVYAFSADFLPVFAELTPTPLEQAEELEQLRALEHGYQIHVSEVDEAAIEINTQADFESALQFAKGRRPQ